jgi:C-terminal processing protease CtpA/Prc
VDVRGNGGGSREALLVLAGYLIGPEEPALVGNVCAFRLAAGFDDDHLESRYAYPADSPDWSDRQRAAIDALLPSFEPEWALPEGFSAWHLMVLDRTGDDGEFFYDRPVAILCDAGCFSATDILLGALERLPCVVLVGRPSSGGSARSQGFLLPASRIEVVCASMASFRPDGRLYDGRGVEVDRDIPPTPEFFLARGADVQLEAALEALED